MPSYIELDKNARVTASSDVSKLIISLNALGQLVVTDNNGDSSFPTFTTASPTYEINLSSGDYSILGGGIYEVVNATGGALIFPNPTSLTGQTITIINSDAGNTTNIQGDANAPYNKGDNTQLSSINPTDQYQFVAIKDKWRGGRFS
jgi:hypothetical protein